MAKNWPTMLEQYEKGEREGCMCFRGIGWDEKGSRVVNCTSTERPLLDSCVKGGTRWACIPREKKEPKRVESREKSMKFDFMEDEW